MAGTESEKINLDHIVRNSPFTKDVNWKSQWDTQKEIVRQMLDVSHKHKIVFLNAPTGSGKSLINLVYANSRGDAYITTPLVSLVDQYMEDLNSKFSGLGKTIKGRSHYSCIYLSERFDMVYPPTAADGPCIEKDPSYVDEDGKTILDKKGKPVRRCPFFKECPYYAERTKAMVSSVSVTTFHYFMYPVRFAVLSSNKGENDKNSEFREEYDGEDEQQLKWGKRSVLVIDEAHNLPDVLVNFFSIEISRNSEWPRFNFDSFFADAERIFRKNGAEEADKAIFDLFQTRLNDYISSESFREEQLKLILEPEGGLNKEYAFEGNRFTLKELQEEYLRQAKLIYRLQLVRQRLDTNAEWIMDIRRAGPGAEKAGIEKILWKPYEAAPFVSSFFNSFDNIVLSSATFLDYDLYVKRLGLEDYGAVEVESGFDPVKGPIILAEPGISVNFKSLGENRERDMGMIVDEIARISFEHWNQKGVVHCHSYPYQKEILKRLPPEVESRAIFHTARNREAVLRKFQNSRQPVILFSVKMDEGTDFSGDQARWQIIVKAPYPDYSDPWVKAHRSRLNNWPEKEALTGIIQACGRIVRSRTDYGMTYILDNNARRLLEKYSDLLPKWFEQRIVKQQ